MSHLFTTPELRALAERVARHARPDGYELMLSAGDGGATRFSGNTISQNVAETGLSMSIKIVSGTGVGRATCNQVDDEAIARAVASARAIARAQRNGARPLPLPRPQPTPERDGWERATARTTPADRARLVAQATAVTRARRLDGAGICETAERMIGIANGSGLVARYSDTLATLSITARGRDGGSGWAEAMGRRASSLRPAELARTAADKASGGRPRRVRPGQLDVVLEPAAVADLLSFLGFTAFGALSYLEKRSPLQGQLGKKVFAPSITIDDDAAHPAGLGIPFDFEGLPRRTVRLVRDGVFEAVVHDRATARRMGTTSTGHSLPQPNTEGPLPLHMVLQPGDATLEDMVRATRRGILVTQFHYTNLLDPGHLVLTGMTRNGTFLIEGGRVTAPVRNLRFTESVLRALARVRAVGRDLVLTAGSGGSPLLCPALAIEGFTFSSATEF